ncbi:MAG: tetratricopeptide repeat protein [Desulfatibacillum sp.]|nr:tetratricopeptide repeat protein [Desulfatibacillum sp.]
MDLYVDGVEAFEAGDYDQALVLLDQAIALNPKNTEFKYFKAQVFAKTGETDQALAIWNALVKQSPREYRKAFFDIAAIYSRQCQYEKALDVLEQAIHLNPKDPRAYMEVAIIQRSMEQYDLAIGNLQMAASLDSKTAPTAHLIMASIYLEREEFDKAEELFRQVGETDAGTPVADAAIKSLEAVEQTRQARKAWYVNGQFAWGYDDNVTLLPLDSAAVQFPSDKEDAFQSLYAEAGYRIINRKDFRLGASFAVNTQGYQDLTENNILSYNPTAFVEILKKDKYYFRFSYDYSYYYTGGQTRDMQDAEWYLLFDADYSKLQTHRLMPTLTIFEPYGLSSVLSFSWMQKDYCDSTPDAHAYQPGLTQNWALPDLPVVLRAGYQFYWEDSEVSNYSYYSHTGFFGASCALPWDLVADAQYTYVRTHFDESPQIWADGQWYSSWVGDRKDSLQGFSANLSKKVTDRVMVLVNYYHGANDSNVVRKDTKHWDYSQNHWDYYGKYSDPYEFKKNVFSVAVSCNF